MVSRRRSYSLARSNARSSRFADPTSRSARSPARSVLAVQLHVARDPAREHLGRVVEAQRLLHPVGNPRWILAHERALLGMAPQPVDRVREHLGGGLVARHDHQVREREDLAVVEPLALRLHLEQHREQIVAGPRAARGDHLAEIAADPRERRDALGRHAGVSLFAVHEQIGAAAQLGAVGARHAEHLADHVHRHLARELVDEVEAARTDERIEIGRRKIADALLERGDPTRREALRDQSAQARVPGRIEREERGACGRLRPPRLGIERHAVIVGEERSVPERREHIGVARQRPEVECVVAVDRRVGAQRRVGRVRILVDLIGVRVVLDFGRLHPRAPRARPS